MFLSLPIPAGVHDNKDLLDVWCKVQTVTDFSGVARRGGQTPSIEKCVHFYCLIVEQKQWLIIKIASPDVVF